MSPNQLLIFNQQPWKTYSDLKPFHFTRNKVSSLFNFSATIFSTSLLASRVFFSSAFSASFFSNSLMISLAPERFAAFSQEFSELQKIFTYVIRKKGVLTFYIQPIWHDIEDLYHDLFLQLFSKIVHQVRGYEIHIYNSDPFQF